MKGLSDIPSVINSPEKFSADLLNYLIPTNVTWLGSGFFGQFADRFTGNHSEQGAYLGLVLILILILQLRDIRRRPYLKPLLVSLLVMVVLSLGPSLHFAGVATNLWLPWRLALHLPLIRAALPTRLSMYVALIAALAIALWLSVANRGWDRARRFILAALACLCLMPNPAMVHWTPLPLPPFFQPENVVSSLGRDANVIGTSIRHYRTEPGLAVPVRNGLHAVRRVPRLRSAFGTALGRASALLYGLPWDLLRE